MNCTQNDLPRPGQKIKYQGREWEVDDYTLADDGSPKEIYIFGNGRADVISWDEFKKDYGSN